MKWEYEYNILSCTRIRMQPAWQHLPFLLLLGVSLFPRDMLVWYALSRQPTCQTNQQKIDGTEAELETIEHCRGQSNVYSNNYNLYYVVEVIQIPEQLPYNVMHTNSIPTLLLVATKKRKAWRKIIKYVITYYFSVPNIFLNVVPI